MLTLIVIFLKKNYISKAFKATSSLSRTIVINYVYLPKDEEMAGRSPCICDPMTTQDNVILLYITLPTSIAKIRCLKF